MYRWRQIFAIEKDREFCIRPSVILTNKGSESLLGNLYYRGVRLKLALKSRGCKWTLAMLLDKSLQNKLGSVHFFAFRLNKRKLVFKPRKVDRTGKLLFRNSNCCTGNGECKKCTEKRNLFFHRRTSAITLETVGGVVNKEVLTPRHDGPRSLRSKTRLLPRSKLRGILCFLHFARK